MKNKKLNIKESKPKEPKEVSLFWTGGFDSTWLLMKLLKEGKTVQPIYVKHSRGIGKFGRMSMLKENSSDKGCKEDESREKILKQLKSEWRKKLEPTMVWDHDQFSLNKMYSRLFFAYELVAEVCHFSPQYSAFQACKDWVEYNKSIQMAIVQFDQLWWNLNSIDRSLPAWKFFNGFEFPLWWVEKISMWRESSRYEKSILRLTYTCEEAKKGKTCIERGLPKEKLCVPCKGRLPMLK